MCTEAEEIIRQQNLVEKIKGIENKFIEAYLLKNSSNTSYNDYSGYSRHYREEISMNFMVDGKHVKRYVLLSVYEFTKNSFSYIAKHSELFQQLRDAYIEIGGIIDAEAESIQPKLSSVIVRQNEQELLTKGKWWKFW